MSVNMVNNDHFRVADDLTLSNKQTAPTHGANDARNKKEQNLLNRLEVIEVKKVEQVNKTDSILQTELDEKLKEDADKLAEENHLANSSVVAEAMKTISEFIRMPIRTVNFTQDDGSEKTIIKIFDSESNELIKQFPSEEILSIAQRIVELQQDVSKKTGILFDESI